MAVFLIRQVRSYKGKTFCLSVYKGGAYWSTHNGVFDINTAKRSFQRSHDQQIQSLIMENVKKEPLTIQN
jgi:hypothetical protein